MVDKNRMARTMGVRKTNYSESLDFIPTPPWATRAFLTVSGLGDEIKGKSVLEPCCGAGHISEVLKEFGAVVTSSDLHDRGYPSTLEVDFLNNNFSDEQFDWAITNPPYAISDQFLAEMWRVSKFGCVMHVRTGWMTGVKRHRDFLSKYPISHLYIHAKNVSATQNKVIRRGSNNFNHSWIVWLKDWQGPKVFDFIPYDSQQKFEKLEEYDD